MANSANLAFKSKIFVSGTIVTLTGLHIGGNSTEMSIGGADSIVIRDPITNYPYIPGSSLRGKMRSLLERHRDEMTINFENHDKSYSSIKEAAEIIAQGVKFESAGPATDGKAASARLFGVAVDQNKGKLSIPQRLIVRDAMLEEESAKKLEKAKHTDMPLTEVKTEVAIDRITSKANPRQIERVPAGAEFTFEFILNLYGDDKEDEFLTLLWECMELLQDDYLGGHGSRGYGRVKFNVKSVTRKTAEDYKQNKPAQSFEVEIPEALRENTEHQA
jgi:CRISPR-associated protein Csm3